MVTSRSAAFLRRVWAGSTAAATGLLAVVALLGESAAVPGLGPRTVTPPWDVAAHPAPWLVTVLAAAGYLAGALAVLAGVRALAQGWRPRSPGRFLVAGAIAAGLLAVVPPAGSADHLSYVAYGRIAAAGDDPYVVSPAAWHGGDDPVAGAVQFPWQDTPSVYGPVATGLQALAALAGHGSLRLTVWWWQLLCAAAFLAVALTVDRRAGPDPARRARAAICWTLNPLLLGQLVLGAHVDVVAAALGFGGLALATRPHQVIPTRPHQVIPTRPRQVIPTLLAGSLLGAAVATKAPYGLFALATLWGLRHRPRPRLLQDVTVITAGALAIVVPAHWWAGTHVFDQLGRASRFTSLATPWRAVVNLGGLVAGAGAVNAVVAPVSLALAAGLAVVLWRRRVSNLPGPANRVMGNRVMGNRAMGDGAQAALALTAAWVLLAPYALPWYDAMVWVPLAVVGPSFLDDAFAARLAVLALAYVPGRAVGLTPAVETVTLGLRTYLAPVLVLATIVAVVRWVTVRGAVASVRGAVASAGVSAGAAPP